MCADIDKGYNPSTPEVKDPESAFYTRPKKVSFIELGLLKKDNICYSKSIYNI